MFLLMLLGIGGLAPGREMLWILGVGGKLFVALMRLGTEEEKLPVDGGNGKHQKLSESGSFNRRPRCERSLSRSAQFSLVNANLRCFRPIICYSTLCQ